MPKWKSKYEEDADDPEIIPDDPLKLVSRSEWTNTTCPESIPSLKLPIMEIVVTITGKNPCETKEQCFKELEALRVDDILKGYGDIAHNFLISTDGTIYEGRGWTREAYRIKRKLDKVADSKQCMQVAFFGTWGTGMDHDRPEMMMCRSLTELVEYGYENDLLVEAVEPDEVHDGSEITEVDVSLFNVERP